CSDLLKKRPNASLSTKLEASRTDVMDAKKAFESSKVAKETLKSDPDDPDANLIVGKYLCFFRNDWGNGLPRINRSKEKVLKALADNEAAKSMTVKEQAALGDGWYDFSMTEAGIAKANILRRALYWYQKAAPGLSGFSKTKVTGRTEAIEKVVTA